MQNNKGFTLIELMITVAIIAILMKVALPAYTQYIVNGKLSEAPANLGAYRVSLEQWYQDNRSYANSAVTGCGVAAPSSKYFSYSCATGSNSGGTCSTGTDCYIATATSKAGVGMGNSGDYTYTVDSSNSQFTTKLGGTALSSNNGCWIAKVGGTC